MAGQQWPQRLIGVSPSTLVTLKTRWRRSEGLGSSTREVSWSNPKQATAREVEMTEFVQVGWMVKSESGDEALMSRRDSGAIPWAMEEALYSR